MEKHHTWIVSLNQNSYHEYLLNILKRKFRKSGSKKIQQVCDNAQSIPSKTMHPMFLKEFKFEFRSKIKKNTSIWTPVAGFFKNYNDQHHL